MNYYMFVMPNNGEPYRFVVGWRRRWLFWKEIIYSYIPVKVKVLDYREFDDLYSAVKKSNKDRDVVFTDPTSFEESHEEYLYYAVRRKSDKVEWYTGRWFSKQRGERKQPETSSDIYNCQMFVRERYATDALTMLNRQGHYGLIEHLYVRVSNIFRNPCIVTLCVNKRTHRVKYVKSVSGDNSRMQYTNWLDEAMLIYPEDCEAMYERLTTQHKAHSFTMIVRPNADIPASEIRQHERELVQRIAYDFKLTRHEAKKD